MNALGIVTVLVMSVLKFFISAPISYGFGHTYMQTLLLTATGGCAGTFGFFAMGKRLMEWFRLRYVRKRAERIAKGIPLKRIFTRTNRWIVRVKRTYGLIGIMVMPPILSIPITAVLAAKYFKHDRRTLPLLLSAVLVWSVILCTAWGFVR